MVTNDPALHEQLMREVLHWSEEMDFGQTPPAMAQRIHRRLRQMTGVEDPYHEEKARQNKMAKELLPMLRSEVQCSISALITAARIAIAGNMIDMGVNGSVSEREVYQAMQQALSEPFFGQQNAFTQSVANACSILYLADNAGEIIFDRLLIEHLSPERVTLAIRGAPVINDATLADAQAAGLDTIVKVISNGSDAPGTLLDDCSPEFRQHFEQADMIIAKGQGNFESLNHEVGNLFFLFKVKCPLVANQLKLPVGTQVLLHPATNPFGMVN